MNSLRYLLLFVLLLAATAGHAEPDPETLTAWMTGTFSSAAQAEADSAYYNIRLDMVPIWTERDDAHWLYVEQAVASMADRPYRQRVYKVTLGEDGVIASTVYTLPDPEKYVGAAEAENPLGDLTPEALEVREGCTVYLKYDGKGQFTGGTDESSCLSTLRGAAYATSEVVVSHGRIESWDRGFDEDGVQVWGAEKGAYIFLLETPEAE